MKKVILTAFAIVSGLLMSSALSAQQKGDFSVGGVIGVHGGSVTTKTVYKASTTQTLKNSAPSTTNFVLSPMFNYFVIDKLELSAGLQYNMLREFSEKDESSDKNLFAFRHIATFNIGLHYYVPIVKDVFFYTPGVEFGFGGGSYVSQLEQNAKATVKVPFAFGLQVDFGKFEFKPTKHLGFSINLLDFTMTLENLKADKDLSENVDLKVTNTSLSSGLNYGMSIGVKYYF